MNSQKTNSKYSKLTEVGILQVIDKAKDAERRQDLDGSKEIFDSTWNNFDEDIDLSGLDKLTGARLLRLFGSFLSRYGHAKGLESFQERGKDLISRAIGQLEDVDSIHEVAEAKVYLASAYMFEGRNDEAGIILDEAASKYQNNQLHPIYLLTRINRITTLHWKKDYQSALEILDQIKIPMDLCTDSSLLAQYHNQAGLILTRIGKSDEAFAHYENAIKKGYDAARTRGVGISLNNLAFFHSTNGNHAEAKKNIRMAFDIFDKLEDAGWLAIVLDTKALVHLRENKLELATESIDKAIGLFEKGERYSALTDAIWVKVCILLRADKKEEAYTLFGELTDIAKREIGEYAVEKYTKDLSKITYSIKDLGYHKEVRAFKRQILKDALGDSGIDTKKAAKKLKLNEDNLITILNKQFPSIYDELGVRYKTAFV